MKKITLCLVIIAAITGFDLCKAQVQMVKDINTTPSLNSSSPSKFVTINGVTFFSAMNVDNGFELWKTDGTTAGTEMLKDIQSGNGSSSPNYLTNVNGTLFFAASSSGYGIELWKSDGTEDGTVMVKDIYPSGSSSMPSQFAAVGSTLYFQAADGTNGIELWKSDGTEAGTVMVKDIYPGATNSSPANLMVMGTSVYFQANDGTNGIELWKSNGTLAGTSLVKDIAAGATNSSPANLLAIGNTLFFSAYDVAGGIELWKSNGTTIGTAQIKDIYPAGGSSSPSYLTAVGTTLFFSANDGTNGIELWKSDSPYNAASTIIVMDIYSGATSSTPQNLTNVSGILYFSATDPVNGTELWLSGGDVSTTGMVQDIYSGISSSSPGTFCVYNNTLYFKATDATSGAELWRSDGTLSGTAQVKDIEAGGSSSTPSYIYSSGTFLIFAAYTGANSIEPWVSDGTSGGTSLLLNINPEIGSSNPYCIINVNDTVYFFASDGINGTELWKSDGTSGGTVMLKDIYPGALGSFYSTADGILNINGTLFFVAQDGTNGVELWKSDRTTAGTVLVKDIFTGGSGSYPSHFMNVNGTLFFWANDGVNGNELWKSDGTTGGTVLVKDIYVGASSSTPSGSYIGSSVSYNNLLYFQANDGTNGYELWQSDGTSGGTMLVKDIYPGGYGYPNGLTVCNGKLFFYATDANGIELWMSDGTPGGTALLKDINPGSSSSSPLNFYNMNGTLLFGANDGAGGELWKSDGTPAGTVLVKNIFPGNLTSIGGFAKVNGITYFRAKDAYGLELWTTDGTTGGTTMLKDINPGLNTSAPSNFTSFHDTVFFTARNQVNGNELFVSTGTVQSTALAADIYPGIGYSAPIYLAATTKALFFSANDGTNGRELWKLTMPAALSQTVTGTNVLCNGGSNGAVDLSVSGGTLPYTYSWSNAATTEDISGLTAGTYTVVVTDAWGWEATKTVTLTQPATTIISISSQSDVSCSGGSNGSVTISLAGGGTSPFSYLWSPGGETTQNLNGLTANNYSVLVTDALGCSNAFSTSVTEPLPVAATTSVTNTSCYSGTNGTAAVNVSAGVSPYSYLWSASSQSTSAATGLSAGTFSVTVTDANGCTGTYTATVSQPTAFSTTVTAVDENCSGGSNGSADLTVSGASSPYTYLWSNGATTQDITNVTSNNYSVTITDSKGCTKTEVTLINQPLTFSALIGKSDVACYGFCNGTATASISGGTAPYQYLWSASNQTTQTISGLCPGIFNVTVTDNHGCVITPNVSITEPSVLTASVTNTGATCGNSDGTATALPSGGNTPYSYAWSGGGQTTQTAVGLALGNTTVTVTDSKGCTTTATTTVTATTISTPVCIVTVDTATSSRNLILWNKPLVTNIDSFRIYREISSAYAHIASVPYIGALSQFIDNTNGVNPNITSYKYKIAAVDTCGGVSDLSSYHRTIHLSVSPALPCGFNLSWNDYEGIGITQYRIMRDSAHTGWKALDSVSYGNTAWTDISCYPAYDSVFYMLEVDNLSGCTPSLKKPQPMKSNLNSSRSNVYRVGQEPTQVINTNLDMIASVYPNPSSGLFTINMKNNISGSSIIKVFNMMGEVVYEAPSLKGGRQTINLSNQAKGVYSLQISTSEQTITKKLVVD